MEQSYNVFLLAVGLNGMHWKHAELQTVGKTKNCAVPIELSANVNLSGLSFIFFSPSRTERGPISHYVAIQI